MRVVSCISRVFIVLVVIILFTVFIQERRTTFKRHPIVTEVSSKLKFQEATLPRSLVNRNAMRLQQLKSHYSQWFDIEAFYQPQSTKTMIYFCHDHCGGWGDRLRGITSVYFLALLTKRRFMIDMEIPCPISDLLKPNLVNWTFVKPWNGSERSRTKFFFRAGTRGNRRMKRKVLKDLKNNDFITLWESYDDIWINTNSMYINAVLENSAINLSSLIGHLPKSMASHKSLFPLLFESLFKPRPFIVRNVDSILRRVEDLLICFHVRVGKNPSNPRDNRLPNRQGQAMKMIEFLESKKDLIKNRTNLIFVTSDSQSEMNRILKHFPNTSIHVPGPIIHIDRIPRRKISKSMNTLRRGFVKVITDFLVLGECDVSILSKSGFSALATRRQIGPMKHVYVLNDDSNVFQKTTLM